MSPPAESPVLFRDSAEWTFLPRNMVMENKKQSFKRIIIKTKIRTTGLIKRTIGLIKRTPALEIISGDGGKRDPDPLQRDPDPEQ